MPLNILRHKSWHPGNAEALERVAVDTAAASARDAATRAAVEAADADAALAALRRRAGLPQAAGSSSVSSASPSAVAKGRAAAAATPANEGVELAPRVPLPWYARAPAAASAQQLSAPISRERSGAANFSAAAEAARVSREEARKQADDPLSLVREELRAIGAPISDYDARAGAGIGGGSRKRGRTGESVVLDGDGLPSLAELRRSRLEREVVEGVRASQILMSAAAAGGLPHPARRATAPVGRTANANAGDAHAALATAAHAALAAARRADAHRISFNR